MRSFGEALKAQRRKLGITQKQVADSVGVSGAYICNLESGKRPPPPYHTVAAIADTLQLDVEKLWNIAVKQREKQAIERSRRKVVARREDENLFRKSNKTVVPDTQIDAFFDRPEIQMTTFGLFHKRPEEMTMEEKRAVYRAINSAREVVNRTGRSKGFP